ncbi:MAG: hypothetical protein U1A78_22655 [Polyangia bacterium]
MEGPSAFDLSRWPHFILTAYRNAGWPAYATTFLSALCGVALTTTWARARAAKKLPLLSLLLLLPLASGLLGYLTGMQNVDAALAAVSPELRPQLLEVGRAEAMCNLYIGGAWAAVLGAVFAVHAAVQGTDLEG